MNPTARALLVIGILQLLGFAGTLISLRVQYQRKRLAAVAAGMPLPASRSRLDLGLWMFWLLCALLNGAAVYVVSLK